MDIVGRYIIPVFRYQLHSSSLVASFVGEKSRSKPNEMKSYLSNQKNQRIRQYSTTTSLPEFKRIEFPRLNSCVDQGRIVSWYKKEGEKVSKGDMLCDIEADKIVTRFQAPEDGYLAKILFPEKSENVKTGKLICVIVENESDIPAFSKFSDIIESPERHTRIQDTVEASDVYDRMFEAPQSPEYCMMKATPFARRIIEEKELDLGEIKGSGPSGRILAADLSVERCSSKFSSRSTAEGHLDLPLLKESLSKQFSDIKPKNFYSLTSEITLDAIEK